MEGLNITGVHFVQVRRQAENLRENENLHLSSRKMSTIQRSIVAKTKFTVPGIRSEPFMGGKLPSSPAKNSHVDRKDNSVVNAWARR